MKVLILAAGYATRLYPITKDFPKPLLEVGGRPMIDYLIEKVNCLNEVDKVLVVTNDKFFKTFQKWAGGQESDKEIKVINDRTKDEKSKLGAIGDMYYSVKEENIDDDLMVMGGDNLFDGSLVDFLEFAKAKIDSPCVGLYDIGSTKHAEKYGIACIDQDGRIVDFKEKSQNPPSTLVAMCLYYFPGSKVKLIAEYIQMKKEKQDASGFYIDWIKDKCPVYGFVFKGKWFDIGHHEFYQQAKSQFERPG